MHKIQQKFVVVLATGFYSGYAPIASGTFGTVVGLPFCYLLSRLDPFEAMLYMVFFAGLAVWLAGEAEKVFEEKDSGLIVIDEMVGVLVTLLFIPWGIKSVVVGFFLFRLMDIVKPFPIRRLERSLPGGWGVVGDDVLAGVYANVALRVVMAFL
ncbi:MAG: phosphatidylglycerophosphatase A [Deltaproteobacteria bacterium]|nr:phosphatidylglycerophosphatase A [Deltaproteobacteria bacterium]MBW2317430.1 phosphatidylglycerophosphatase A [Deltaproteobacteria bacterium]MBW2600673.1 phosphatidylglycerophosphatase A [Deltaproteobacteria bacterium]